MVKAELDNLEEVYKGMVKIKKELEISQQEYEQEMTKKITLQKSNHKMVYDQLVREKEEIQQSYELEKAQNVNLAESLKKEKQKKGRNTTIL